MLTINWWRALGNIFTETKMNNGVNYVSAMGYGDVSYYGTPEVLMGFGRNAFPSPCLSHVITDASLPVPTSYGVIFGTGTVKPTADVRDIWLSGDMITDIAVTATLNSDPDYSYSQVSATYSIKNTGTEPVTIGEVAAFANRQNSASTTYKGKGHLFMMERTVLDTPLTIAVGETKELTYTVRLDFLAK